MGKSPTLTTEAGIPVADNQHSLTAGPRGPLLAQDWQLFEKHAHFNRERIPERVVHAKGSAAYGTLKITSDELARYSRARLFARTGKLAECFLRFSTVAGESGAADAERDVRGFALKVYTEEGNWDLVGNNTPVFFVRDPYKFPDFIHSQKRDPKTNMRSATAMWDFWSLSPESLHQITILFSDRGCPKTLRHMNGYGSHTYSLLKGSKRVWVKFHFKTMQGHAHLTDQQSAELIGKDRESHQRDLFESIDKGEFPRWRFCVQIMSEEQARNAPFNPFDLTKVWPQGEYPLIEAGVLELNRNPENYFSEVEQSAFSPANVIPGIGHSPDKMLQFRIFSYADAHRYRLGVNHGALPVNRPRCAAHVYHRDGMMRFDENGGGSVNYEPNSFDGPQEDASYKEPRLPIEGHADRYNHRKDNDDYTQPGALFRLMNSEEQQRLFHNIGRSMDGVPDDIRQRQLEHFHKIDPACAAGVKATFSMKLPKKSFRKN